MDVKSRVKSLATPCVPILDRKYWFSLPTFQRSNSVTKAVAKLLTRDLTSMDHPSLKPHSP